MMIFCARNVRGFLPLLGSIALVCVTSGCVLIPEGREYAGPKPRPPEIETYYSRGSSYSGYEVEATERIGRVTMSRIRLFTETGDVTISYFKRGKNKDTVILVFPILGGGNLFSGYFARYFSRNGYDSAIIHRNGAFKKPYNFYNLEEILRQNIIRDRIALDFFEREFKKKNFASFGISRGAINAAILAGVDPRLKHNVLALGATDLANVFKYSNENGIRKYYRRVTKANNIDEDEFYRHLESSIRTDPKNVAPYINAENTLLFLSAFDTTVPFEYGLKLRKQIGRPETVVLMSGHFTALAFTRFVPFFPVDYIEAEALSFYDEAFKTNRFDILRIPVRILQYPIEGIIRFFDVFM